MVGLSMSRLLLDSTVLIDALRGEALARRHASSACLSAVRSYLRSAGAPCCTEPDPL